MEEATKADILAALDDSGKRFVSMVRGLDPDRAARPVPGLAWTAVETAAHVVTVLGRLLGDRRRAAPNEGVAELNATCLSEYTDRDINDIADRLEANLRTVIDRVYSKVDFDRLYPFHGGSTISGGGGLDGSCASCSSTATTSPLQPETSGGCRPRRHPSRFVALLSR